MSTISKFACAAVSVALVAATVVGAQADDRGDWLRSLQQQRGGAYTQVAATPNDAAPALPRATVYTRRPAGTPMAPAQYYTRAPSTVVAPSATAALQNSTAGPVASGRMAPVRSRNVGGRIILQPLTPAQNRARATANRQAALSPYGAMPQMDPKYLPTVIAYAGPERPGTIIIDTTEKYLYFVQADGTARRYGVGIGRPGFGWTGSHKVSMKREWPGWTPPAAMRLRQPDLPTYMEGGPENPLGARAMYLGSSIYRIHGSNAPWTIGTEVSSGCFRMRNEDVTELYDLVKVGTRVVVL